MYNKLILGTVQFGLTYGINNTKGKPTEKEVFEIFDMARSCQIDTLDTAEEYGDAINIIGNYHRQKGFAFNVISKFRNKETDIYSQIENTVKNLHISKLDTLLFHSFSDYYKTGITKELKKLKENDLLDNIGISIYTNEELAIVVEDPEITVIQLPYNLLDNHNQRGNLLLRAKAKGKKVHTRSVFLQGLFFMEEHKLPARLLPLKIYLQQIKDLCIIYNISISQLALNYVLYTNYIDKIIIGVDNKNQLMENLQMASLDFDCSVFKEVNNIQVSQPELLNPAKWKQ